MKMKHCRILGVRLFIVMISLVFLSFAQKASASPSTNGNLDFLKDLVPFDTTISRFFGQDIPLLKEENNVSLSDNGTQIRGPAPRLTSVIYNGLAQDSVTKKVVVVFTEIGYSKFHSVFFALGQCDGRSESVPLVGSNGIVYGYRYYYWTHATCSQWVNYDVQVRVNSVCTITGQMLGFTVYDKILSCPY